VTGLPAGLSIDSATGLITGTIDNSASQSGPFNIQVTATDGTSSTTQSFTWAVTNPGPSANIDNENTTQDATVSGNVLANDSDPDLDSLTVTGVGGTPLAPNPAGVGNVVAGSNGGEFVVNADGTFTFDPNGEFASLADGQTAQTTVNYQISDGEGGFDNASIVITVTGENDAPVVTDAIPDQFNQDADSATLDTSLYFDDIDTGDVLAYSVSGLPAGLSIDSGTGVISGTIDNSASQPGLYSVTVIAEDSLNLSTSITFDWTVTNPGPTAEDNAQTITHLSQSSITGNVITDDNGSGTDSDPDGDAFLVDQVNGSTNFLTAVVTGSHGTLDIAADGSYQYDLDDSDPAVTALQDGEVLTDTFTYTIDDSEGGTATATLTITIAGANDTPVVGGTIPPQADVDGDTVSSLDVTSYFSDPDGDSLSYAASNLPPGLSINSTTGLITGTLDTSASQSAPGGVYTITVTASDPDGQQVATTFDWTITNPAPIAQNDSFTIDEDTTLNDVVDGNDSDPDGDAVTFTQLTNGSNGTANLNSDGTFSYTPDDDFFGTDSFDYEIVDADGATSTATVTITIDSVNDVPVVDTPIADQTNLDNNTVSLTIASNFSDPEGDVLTFSATGLPPGLTIDSSGTISGTIDTSASQGGPYTVTVTADDGNGGVVTDTFSWTVNNPTPTAGDDNFVMNEDAILNATVTANDSDSDGDSLTYNKLTDPASGTVDFNPDGTFSYTPVGDYNGTVTFDYEIVDADGATDTATVTIQVTPFNDAPVVDVNIPDQLDTDSSTINLDVSGNFSDPDGHALSFTATGLPTGLSIDSAGNITGTIDSSASQSGPFTVVVTADDSNGGTVTDTFTWTVTNPAPVAENDTFTIDEDTSLTNASVTGNDSDADNDSLTYNKLTDPASGTVTFNSDGTFDYTPPADFHGVVSFDYEVVDADGATETATVTITVNSINDLPVVDTPIPDQSSLDSDVVSLDISGSFSDPEGDTLSFSATGLPTGLSIDSAGNITGTVDSSASQNGPYTVVVTADDGNGGTVTDTFTWSVANPTPTAVDDNFTTDEDTVLNASVATNDSDGDNDTFSFNKLTDPSSGVLTFNPDGTFEYSPAADYFGTVTFDYEIVDADGATDVATATIVINSVNDLPIVDTNIPDQNNSDNENISLSIGGNFSDPEGDPLTFSATGLPTGLSMDSAGNITGTLDSSASAGGPYIVVVTADDGNGGTVTDTFTWIVDNPAPIAGDDSIVVEEDTPYTGSVTGNDGDPDGDSVSYNQLTNPSNGMVTFNSDGTFTYTANNGYIGGDSFSYEIVDADGASAVATVIIDVVPVNEDPVVDTNIPNQFSFDGQPININVSGNFSDPDGDPLTFTATGLPPGVSMSPSGVISGLLDSSASAGAPYTVVVTAFDGVNGTVTDTFSWMIVNPGPSAIADSFSTDEDTQLSASVATNDSDPDGDELTFTQLSDPSNGSVAMNPDGSFTYTPGLDFSGTVSFEYQATDADGVSTSAVVTIDVIEVNDDPVLDTPIPDQSDSDTDVIDLDISGHFSDDISGLTFTATGLPPGLSMDPSGQITGTLDSSASVGGPYSVDVLVVDADGSSVTDQFIWNVDNPAPMANSDTFTTGEDATLSASVTANDSDPDNDSVTYNVVTDPLRGSLTLNSDGTFEYVPEPDFNGMVSFTYEIVDADGATDTAVATINVLEANDSPTVNTQISDQTNTDSSTVSLDISGNFSDVEQTDLTYSVTGLPPGLSMDAAGLITGTIDSSASQGGPYTVVVTAADGEGGQVEETFLWTVTNPGPVSTDDNFVGSEDTDLNETVANNDFDPDGDTLTYALITNPTDGNVVLNSDGSFTYTPDPGFNGIDSFQYEITDADGATSIASVTLDITGVNDVPEVASEIPDQSDFDSDTINLDVSGNFYDADSDTLTFVASGLPTGLTISASGVISGTIDSSASTGGPYTVTVTANDGVAQVSDTFTWTVSNPAPVGQNETFTIAEDTQLNASVTGTDSDNDALVFNQLTDPASGNVTLNSDGSFSYTPVADFYGIVSFDYEVVDADGASNSATVTIDVTSVNDAPVVSTPIPDQTNTDSDSITLDVSGNFSDLEGDSLAFSATGLPTGLSIDSAGNITGTIDSSASQSGPFTVMVTADDGNGDSVTDTFTWNVSNPGPVANNDTFNIDEDTPLNGSVGSNDSDPDGDNVTFNQLTNPASGTVTFNSDGTFDYTPAAGFNGQISFDYEIVDADGATETATVTINVSPVNDLPVVDTNIPDMSNVDRDLVSLDISGNFSDPDAIR
jgi:VCBS repeat-containing protein